MKFLLALLALIPSVALADIEPFFTPTGLDTTQWYASAGWRDADWNYCWWKPAAISRDGDNAIFTIESKADFSGTNDDIPVPPNPNSLPVVYVCGQLQSPDVSRYGLYQVRMKTAPGSGTNSNFFTYNMYPHDEIDFEFLGLHPTQVSINYWAAGVQSPKIVNLGFDASKDFHTYAFDWEPDSITWFVDGKQVYKTAPGAKIPTHYSKQYVGLWVGMPGWLGKYTYVKDGTNAEFAWVDYTPSLQASPYYGKHPYVPGMDTSQPVKMQ